MLINDADLLDSIAVDSDAQRRELLLQRYVNSSRYANATPLVIAARNGHAGVLEYLLSVGADPCVTGTVSFDGEVISE